MLKRLILNLGCIVTAAIPLVTTISCFHEGETQCNDGTFSDAKGRGACSHHGGVKTWSYHKSNN